MRNLPLFETFIFFMVVMEAVTLVSFDVFDPRSEFYQLMSGIMPQGAWGLMCFLAALSQGIGLLFNISIFRYIGLGISGAFFLCLFIINTFEFPNLMSGITLTIAAFCFASWAFVSNTDTVQTEPEDIQKEEQ